MKNKISKAGVAVAALILALGSVPGVHAQLTLRYEEGANIGQEYNGAFSIKLFNFDMGTIYGPLPAVGASAGYSGSPGPGVNGGITTLNGLPQVGATGAMNGEDSWGIARVTDIFANTGERVWSEAVKQQQLTIFFYGAQDFYVEQLANGFQEINSIGLHVNLYLQNFSDPGYTPYNFGVQGSAGRGGLASYNTVTDGTLILSAVSTPGFIYGAGDFGGLATEFSSNFNQNSGGGGQAYLSVTGGTDAARFDTNGFSGNPLGTTADLFAQFTTDALGTQANPAVSDWLLSSQDPVKGTFAAPAVPEPSTYGMMAAGLLVGVVAMRRRFQKRVQG